MKVQIQWTTTLGVNTHDPKLKTLDTKADNPGVTWLPNMGAKTYMQNEAAKAMTYVTSNQLAKTMKNKGITDYSLTSAETGANLIGKVTQKGNWLTGYSYEAQFTGTTTLQFYDQVEGEGITTALKALIGEFLEQAATQIAEHGWIVALAIVVFIAVIAVAIIGAVITLTATGVSSAIQGLAKTGNATIITLSLIGLAIVVIVVAIIGIVLYVTGRLHWPKGSGGGGNGRV